MDATEYEKEIERLEAKVEEQGKEIQRLNIILQSESEHAFNQVSEQQKEIERLKLERKGFLNHLKNRIDRYSGFSGRNEELSFLQSLLDKYQL